MIRRFLLLNGLAVLGVVLNHSAAWGFIALFWWTHRYWPVDVPNFDQMGNAVYLGLRGVEQLIMFSIPAFLFVSGFFIAVTVGRQRANVSGQVIWARLVYLIIPYLLWSAIIFLGDFLQGEVHSATGYAWRILTGGATAAYYYVPLLCQLYLLSPLLAPLARSRPLLLLLATGMIQLTAQTVLYLDTLGLETALTESLHFLKPSWFFPGHLFWFTAGIVVGFNLKAFQRFLTRGRWLWLAATLFLFGLGVYEWEAVLRFSGQDWLPPRNTIIDSFYAAAFILTFLAFDKVSLPFPKQVGDLGGKAYGVYLAHMPAIELTARGVYHIFPALLAYQILFVALLAIAGLAVPLLLMAVVSLSWLPTRRYYRYVFG